MISTLIIYTLTGIAAGLLSGILGIGGGIIVVPSLAFIFNHDPSFPANSIMQFAAGTSLAVILFTAPAAIFSHYKLDTILWKAYQHLAIGVMAGAFCGALSASFLATRWLKIFFSLFLFVVAFKMLTPLRSISSFRLPPRWAHQFISFSIGFKSGLLGIGGGVLTVPYLSYCGLEMRKIAPISALCTLTIALIGTLVFALSGFQENSLPVFATGYIYWPAVINIAIFSSVFANLGAKLTYILPVQKLRYIFVAILLATALRLLY